MNEQVPGGGCGASVVDFLGGGSGAAVVDFFGGGGGRILHKHVGHPSSLFL